MFIGDLLYTLLVLSILIIGVISFTLFIRRLLFNTSANTSASNDINKKLDRIIELLEKQSE
ncbi:DUF4083 domain-containing protein [Bacillus salacetis]|uniref:DUF4083 domain-containing protein n=1 Tax=Bacillus salacetis TaxID=2315464 RepID=UPI003BA1A320